MFLGDYHNKGVVLDEKYYELFPPYFVTKGRKKAGLVPYLPICFLHLKKKIEVFRKLDKSFKLEYDKNWESFLRMKFSSVYKRFIRNCEIKQGKNLIDYEYVSPPPYPHQKIGTTLLIENDFFALFTEQGTGKTRMVIDALSYLCKQGKINKVVVSAPISVVKSGWEGDLAKFSTVNYRIFNTISKKSKERNTLIEKWLNIPKKEKTLDILFIGYDSLWRLFPILLSHDDIKTKYPSLKELWKFVISAIKFSGKDNREKVLKKVKESGDINLYRSLRLLFGLLNTVEVVVADESQRIKTYSAKRTKAFMYLSQNANRVYILSGTPMPNSPVDIFAQFKVLHPYFFSTKTLFIEHLTETVITKSGWKKFRKAKHKVLEQIIASVSYIVKKEDVLKDLPEKIFVPRDIFLTEKTYRYYQKMKNELAFSVEDVEKKIEKEGVNPIVYANGVLAKLVKLNQIVGGTVINEDGDAIYIGNEKVKGVLEILEEIGKEPVVIWANYKAEISLLHKELKKAKYNVEIITGETPLKERERIIKDFQEGNVDVLVANPKTLGTGVTLTRARYCIYYSLTFNLEDFLQSQDRLHRIGQKHNVVYYILLSVFPVKRKGETPIDREIYRNLQDKKNISDDILNFAKKILHDEVEK